MKSQSRVDFDDDDTLIEDVIIPAATLHVDGKDGWLQRALIDQTWDLHLPEFPASEITIPLPPLIEVVELVYRDEDGVEQTISPSNYSIDESGSNAKLVRKSDYCWPTTDNEANPVRLRFRAGYVDTGNSPVSGEVPAPIKAGILLYGATLYANRETLVIGQSVVELPWAAEELLKRYRVYI